MTWGGWSRSSWNTPDERAFSAKAVNNTPVVLSFAVVVFAIVTQLLDAADVISLSTTQQLTMWLVALGLVVLLSIAYMACHAYLTANNSPPDASVGVLVD